VGGEDFSSDEGGKIVAGSSLADAEQLGEVPGAEDGLGG